MLALESKPLLSILMAASLGLALPTFAFAAETVQVKIDGMVCSFCAQGVEKKFKAMDAVAQVKVDMTAKTVTLSLKEGAALDEAKIRAVVTESGFAVKGLERQGTSGTKPQAQSPEASSKK